MTYLIVTEQETVLGDPFESYDQAFVEATRLFGEEPSEWINRNVRVEENR